MQGLDAVPRGESRLHRPPGQGRQGARLWTCSTCATGSRGRGTSGIYTRVLPLAYRLIARGDSGGMTGITADDFFVTDQLDRTTMVLFATASRPRRAA